MTRARTRTSPRRRLRLVPSAARAGALLGIVGSALALYGLATAGIFTVRNVDVSPLRWTDGDALRARLTTGLGANAFRLSTAGLPDVLRDLPAIRDVAVRVALPDTLVVSVAERTPILAWRVGPSTFLADRDGMLFATATNADDAAGLPLVTDTRSGSRVVLAVGSRLDGVDLDAATRLASLVPGDVGSTATALRVRITDDDGFVVGPDPASWIAVFGSYGHAVRSPDLIPGQVRLLRSLLGGQELTCDRIVLADDRNGTCLPAATPAADN